jgi:ubiquinone/menaquinone biosynthesis C-methylase UbiE
MRITWKGILRALRRRRKKQPPVRALVMGALEGQLQARPVEITRWLGGPEGERLREIDSWFHGHYMSAPYMIRLGLAPHLDLTVSRVLDLGCGDGIMALGMRQMGTAHVAATDLTRAFDNLLPRAREVLGMQILPEGLEFRHGRLGLPLPFADAEFDGVYSWSVFEHVDGVDWLLAEVLRILRPGGAFYLQIEPLYYSPYGSHLLRLIGQPWAHLLHEEQEYLALAQAAEDRTPVEEMDLLYRNNEFSQVKQYLIGEYLSLNRLRTIELVDAVRRAGFEILSCELGQIRDLQVPAVLIKRYDMHDLLTNEIRLVMRRP